MLRRGSSGKGGALPSASEGGPSSSSPPPIPTAASPLPVSGYVVSPSGMRGYSQLKDRSSTLPTTTEPIPPTGTPATPPVPAALQQSIKDTKPTFTETSQRLAKTAAASNAIQEEKARAVFVKYGFKLEPGEWTSPTSGDAERVEKIVRIRIRRTCHRCDISFGADKVCLSCQHTRCKKCPRYPPKRPKDYRGKRQSKGPAVGVDENFKGTGPSAIGPLTILQRPSEKELFRREPVQRARRLCHKCDTPFDGRAISCENCNHQRCPECPRDPYVDGDTESLFVVHQLTTIRPKLGKYVEGYPGDAEETLAPSRRELKTIRVHVRWTCHTCQTVFKDLEKVCRACGHERCEKCGREPPEEEEAGLDEAAVEKINEMIRNVNIAPQAPAA